LLFNAIVVVVLFMQYQNLWISWFDKNKNKILEQKRMAGRHL
jgi:hypothetical protein